MSRRPAASPRKGEARLAAAEQDAAAIAEAEQRLRDPRRRQPDPGAAQPGRGGGEGPGQLSQRTTAPRVQWLAITDRHLMLRPHAMVPRLYPHAARRPGRRRGGQPPTVGACRLHPPTRRGHYSMLPLGQRVRSKVERIIREEMDAIGGQQFHLPAMHPAEIWRKSGRWDAIGDEMFRLRDRKSAEFALDSPTRRSSPCSPPSCPPTATCPRSGTRSRPSSATSRGPRQVCSGCASSP